MKSCLEVGAEVYLSPAADSKRKTRFTWELIKINNNWVGINTGNPNRIAYESVKEGLIPGLPKFTNVKREVKYLDSRFDIYAENESEKSFIEVKNVTLKEGKYALFPDAITIRGQKHLKTLIKVVGNGMRAVMLYIIQRNDVKIFAPAGKIDSEYAKLLKKAHKKGVEIIPVQVKVSPKEILISKILPFDLQ
jgi:sugar fermentation stimulation protein A